MISHKSCRRMSVCFCRYPLVLHLLKDGPYLTQSKLLFSIREMWKRCLMTVDLGLSCGLWQSNEVCLDYPRSKTEMRCFVACEVFKQCQCTPVCRFQLQHKIPLDMLWLSEAAVHVQGVWLSRSMAMCRQTAKGFPITGASWWENAFSKTEYVLWDPLEMSQFRWLQGAAFCIWSRLIWSKQPSACQSWQSCFGNGFPSSTLFGILWYDLAS